jgi:BirA family transcriptional regulator, biotin operon repressor / biotin---[acetyl-CoA-carboxylase] ligase
MNSGQPVGSHFSRTDIERIVAETFIEQIDYQHEIASTNDRALQLAKEQPASARLLVLTDNQTVGRGRGSNRWWAAKGALTFSVLLTAEAISLPSRQWPQLALIAGLAVCEAIEDLLKASSPVRLKWPNDVYLDGRKVSGILVETADGQSARLVIGIGINVNNAAHDAPSELRGKAIALCEAAKREISRVDVLVGVLQRLSSRLDWIGSREGVLREQWQERCLLAGRTVQIEMGARQLVGKCLGIDDDGALLLDTDRGCERCLAGVVTQW